MTDHELLGVAPGASVDDLKRAFRQRALELDPGIINGKRRKAGLPPDPEADARFREVVDAFKRLAAGHNGGEVPAWATEWIGRLSSIKEAALGLDIPRMLGEMQVLAQDVQDRRDDALGAVADVTESISTGVERLKAAGRGAKGIWNFITGKKS